MRIHRFGFRNEAIWLVVFSLAPVTIGLLIVSIRSLSQLVH